MLPKKNRISRKEISEIFKVGRVVYSSNFFLKYLINKDSNTTKVSFSAPKSISNKAYQRNKLRRMGYDAIVNKISLLPKGFIGVFVFKKKSILGITSQRAKNDIIYTQINQEIKDILGKI